MTSQSQSQTELEFAEFDSNNLWTEVYQRLKNESSLSTMGEDFSTSHARDPENRRKNRYRDVSPYDHSRVTLSGANDYINASLIQVPEANRRYILTQHQYHMPTPVWVRGPAGEWVLEYTHRRKTLRAVEGGKVVTLALSSIKAVTGPLDHTMCDFWQMTWEQESRAIIMLNRVIEKGTLKCSQYWPLGEDLRHDDEMYFPECGLRVTLTDEQGFKHFTLRTLEMEKMETGETREVLHFHYTTWPDFGVPSSPNAFLHFLHAVRQKGSLDADVGPAIIHCSAGIGRSGTFCLVDSCLLMVEEKSALDFLNVKETLIKMRYFRMGLIQTADQLRFSYLAIIQGSQAILSGQGLSILEDSSCVNSNNVEANLPPPPPPERVSSLEPPAKPAHLPQELLDMLDPSDTQPPPLPPKKNSPEGQSCSDFVWGEEEEEEFDQLIDRDEEDGDTSEDEVDADRLAEERHRIREERKQQTQEKIRQMKEKQRKSIRCKSDSFFGPKVYFGLAILVGVAGVVIYKYFL